MKVRMEMEFSRSGRKRPHGTWEHISESRSCDCRCSNCKTRFTIGRLNKWKWCPVCGARMKDDRSR